MQQNPVYQCACPECQRPAPNPTQALHQQLNLFLSTLDEHQRRLFVGLESKRFGRGGDKCMAQITGLTRNTIAHGRHELAQTTTLTASIRVRGAGRKRVEKKTRRSSPL